MHGNLFTCAGMPIKHPGRLASAWTTSHNVHGRAFHMKQSLQESACMRVCAQATTVDTLPFLPMNLRAWGILLEL